MHTTSRQRHGFLMIFLGSIRRLSLFLSFLFIGWSAPCAFSAPKDAAGTNWSNPANWSPAGVPGPGDHIIINESTTEISGGALTGTTRRTYRFNSDTTLEVQDIQILSLGTGTGGRALVPNSGGASVVILNGGRGAGIPLIDHQGNGTFEIVASSTGTLSLTLANSGTFHVQNAASTLFISAPIGEQGGPVESQKPVWALLRSGEPRASLEP